MDKLKLSRIRIDNNWDEIARQIEVIKKTGIKISDTDNWIIEKYRK